MEVGAGLAADPKSLPCRFFYDKAGSALFEEICDLPEYYLTRAEREILAQRAPEIAALFPRPITLAELGSGSSAKTRLLIEALLRRQGSLRYVPVDISRSMLEESAVALLERYHALEIHAIASEYQEGLRHVHEATDGRKLIAWLGSNVGNFERGEAARFVRGIRQRMGDDDRLLLGIDLRKSRRVLEAAYDDEAGVTARFNKNLLVRINEELDADFDPEAFDHRAVWDEERGRIEMRLVSRQPQSVHVRDLDLEVKFAAGDYIHTENSYKYSFEEIDELARGANLTLDHRWLDSNSLFSLNLLSPN